MPITKDTIAVISRKVEFIFVSNAESLSATCMANSGLPAKLAALQLLLAKDRAQNHEAAEKLSFNLAPGPPCLAKESTPLHVRPFHAAVHAAVRALPL